MSLKSVLILWLHLCSAALAFQPCVPQAFDSSSFVCVCNSTYCDNYDPVVPLPRGQVLQSTSSMQQHRFLTTSLAFSPQPGNDSNSRVQINVDRSQTFQTIFGFGGSFTDASGINIAKLSEAAQDLLIESYFDATGIDYSLGRVNMGGCDFSPRPYSYVDTPGDIALATFALQEEDLVYKIPYIKKAQALREQEIKLFGSPWTAPRWMKSNNDFVGQGHLLPEYYQPYANYFVRFLQEYESQGVRFWGLTTQNEPIDGEIPDFPFNSMGWNATTQSEFVTKNLGPTLHNAGYDYINVMILDDQRLLAPKWAREVFSDPLAYLYVAGVAIHWYTDNLIDLPHALDMVHEEFPDKFLLYSEACNGFGPVNENSVELGSWERGEKYLYNILDDLNHWVVGWTDWNIALDMQGGPNWSNMAADSPIIVESNEGQFYKQPMYFALGHISRFMQPGSVRVDVQETSNSGLEFAGVERPDGGIAITLMNRDADRTCSISMYDPEQGYVAIDVGPSSIQSIVYWP